MHDCRALSEESMELWHEVAGEGRPVLLIHEGICDSRMWESQWRTFPQFHRTVRCDLRGFGQTPLPAESYSNARDVVELLDRLELGAAALVGVSLGGRVPWRWRWAGRTWSSGSCSSGPGLPGHAWSDTVRRYGEEEDAAVARRDLEAAVEANLRMWVDGPNRLPEEVDPRVRSFVGMMQRRALELQAPLWEEVEEELLVPDVGSRYAEVRVPRSSWSEARTSPTFMRSPTGSLPGFRARAKLLSPEPPTCQASNVPRSSTGWS
jgi:pimeloyl-ACP methyl ester carboxylesterase